MRHAGTQCLETPRLLLRPLTPEDAPAMFRNWASDPVVTKYLRWDPHRDEAFTRALLTEWAALYRNPDYYQWAMVEKSTGEVFGTISLFDLRFDPEAPITRPIWQAEGLNCDAGMWEAGYCIGRNWWGQGYTTEALRTVVDFWFNTVGADWLACVHAKANPASGAVMRKVGFVPHHEGPVLRFDGTSVDCVYALLRRENFFFKSE